MCAHKESNRVDLFTPFFRNNRFAYCSQNIWSYISLYSTKEKLVFSSRKILEKNFTSLFSAELSETAVKSTENFPLTCAGSVHVISLFVIGEKITAL